jgi:hypothetical protein
MNTIGKILVVLNLLFALVTGGFLVYDYMARTNWRAAAENNESAFKAAQASRDAALQMMRNALAKEKKLQYALDGQLIDSKAAQAKFEIQRANLEKELKAAKDRANEAVSNQEKALAEAQRRQKEVEVLQDVVAKREKEIQTAQAETTNYRNQALQEAAAAKAAIERSRGLLEQLKQRELEIAKLQQPGGPGGIKTASVRDPNYENPPSAYVKGRIMKIDAKDRALVEINLGSDVGVNENNTLEVYRMRPALYLGRLRIVESHPHVAIGRLVRPAGAAAPALQEGDEVSSTIR